MEYIYIFLENLIWKIENNHSHLDYPTPSYWIHQTNATITKYYGLLGVQKGDQMPPFLPHTVEKEPWPNWLSLRNVKKATRTYNSTTVIIWYIFNLYLVPKLDIHLVISWRWHCHWCSIANFEVHHVWCWGIIIVADLWSVIGWQLLCGQTWHGSKEEETVWKIMLWNKKCLVGGNVVKWDKKVFLKWDFYWQK